jgi:adenylate kinase family enzyme
VGRAIAARIGARCTELDSIFHQAGWQPLPKDEFIGRVSAIVAGETWVVDGNYSAVRPHIWARADAVVWIDLPRHVVMRQIIWRTLRRISRREELWNGNRERWANFFSLDPYESVIAWAWHKHAEYRTRYEAAMADPAFAHIRFVRLRTRAECNGFVSADPADDLGWTPRAAPKQS